MRLAAVLAWAGAGQALLVAGKLQEHTQLLFGELVEGAPEELDVVVCLAQTNLVHGVVPKERQIDIGNTTNAELKVLK